MASEVWCGEGEPPRESWAASVVGGVLVVAGAGGPPAGLGGVWVVPAGAGGSAEEATVFSVEPRPEAEAPDESVENGFGEEVRLLLEDIIQVVLVVAEEDEYEVLVVVEEDEYEVLVVVEEDEYEVLVVAEEDEYEAQGHGVQAEEPVEKPEQQEREEPELGPRTVGSPLEALEALQLELSSVNARASRAFSRLKLNISQRRKRHLEDRSTLIQSIPGFWVKAFVNHAQMSAMISEQDEDMLSYMINLKVEELRHPSNCCKIMLFFRNNPYFRNKVIVKEYLISVTGYRASHSTAIQWYQKYEREAYKRRHRNSSLNFFNWFSDHNFAGSSRIAEIIIEDLWPNPLQYYSREEGSRRGK